MSLTLPQRIEAASATGGVTFITGNATESVSWTQLHHEARAMAAQLQARGVGPGDHVALLGPTSRLVVTAIQATWLAGAAAVMLPLPMRLGSLEEFVVQTRGRLHSSDARLCLIGPALAGVVEPAPKDPPLIPLDQVAHGQAGRFEAPAPDAEALAIIQFTSGSTAEPKGVMLPHAQVGANVEAICEGLKVTPDDVIVSWLPLYHDMGLIGCLTVPMVTGAWVALASPQEFMSSPSRWVEWMSSYRGTCTAGPNFGYALAARAMARMNGLDLSSWRVAFNGAEPIDPATVEAFCATGERHGLDPRSVFCGFGMAEATLAVTFPELWTGFTTDAVERSTLEGERAAVPADPKAKGTRRLARLGRPIGDLEIRIVDPEPSSQTPRLLGEREVGELQVRGSSVTPGYYANPEATAEAFTSDGWLRTGDLAYVAEGDLVVCGRSKDVIIVGGRNVYPEDVERAVAGVAGVRPGNVIAFGVEGSRGREGLVVVAETRQADAEGLRRAVADRVRHSVGLPPRDVVLVGPGSLPKTSSGKLQRSLCRQRYLEAHLQPA
jgi:fatty-acyl-CoA synthase